MPSLRTLTWLTLQLPEVNKTVEKSKDEMKPTWWCEKCRLSDEKSQTLVHRNSELGRSSTSLWAQLCSPTARRFALKIQHQHITNTNRNYQLCQECFTFVHLSILRCTRFTISYRHSQKS